MKPLSNEDWLKALKLDHLRVTELDLRLRPDEWPTLRLTIDPTLDGEALERIEVTLHRIDSPPALDLDKMCADALGRVNEWLRERCDFEKDCARHVFKQARARSTERHAVHLASHRERMADAGFYGYPGGHHDALLSIYGNPDSIAKQFELIAKQNPGMFR